MTTRIVHRQRRQINLDARVKTIAPLYLFGGIRYNLLDKMKVVEHLWGRISGPVLDAGSRRGRYETDLPMELRRRN